LIYNTEELRAKRNGRPPVSPEKILEMTKDYWNLRVAANLIMPFAPRFSTPYKFYLDKSREYDRVYGINSALSFLKTIQNTLHSHQVFQRTQLVFSHQLLLQRTSRSTRNLLVK
jgi:hypothetical protein